LRYSSRVQNVPPYPLQSVDNALRLAQLLQTEGSLRLTDAAARLNVAPSTAHRLLAMLVYRDFAHQRSDRTYAPGRALRPLAPADAPVPLLREVCVVPMQSLVDRVQESVHLMVLAGAEVRFIATVECRRVLGVGDRTGRTLPAHITSGGKAMLAALSRAQLDERHAEMPPAESARLRRELALVRRRGYALNHQQTETGLTAIGAAVHDREGCAQAAVCIAMPTARFHRDRLTELVAALRDTTHDIEAFLAVTAQTEAS
jgi:IclR family transcriptional regulator, acetate operon repressor